METIDNARLIEAAQNLVNEVKQGVPQPWELSQEVIQHFTDVNGNKFTLKVLVQPFDERSMELEK